MESPPNSCQTLILWGIRLFPILPLWLHQSTDSSMPVLCPNYEAWVLSSPVNATGRGRLTRLPQRVSLQLSPAVVMTVRHTRHHIPLKWNFNCHNKASWHFLRMIGDSSIARPPHFCTLSLLAPAGNAVLHRIRGNSTLSRSTTLSVPMTHRPLPYRIPAHA